MFTSALLFNSIPMLKFSTSAPILPIPCWTKPSVALAMILYLTKVIKIHKLWLQKKASRCIKRKQNSQPSQAWSSRIWGIISSFWAYRFGFRQKPKHVQQLFAPLSCYFAVFWQNPHGTRPRTSTGLLVFPTKKVQNPFANLFQTLCLRTSFFAQIRRFAVWIFTVAFY